MNGRKLTIMTLSFLSLFVANTNYATPNREIVQETTQQKTVQGVITDAATGETLPGATVVLKGTQNVSTTDLDGKFSINAEPGETLVITYIGYKTMEVVVSNQSTLNIAMHSDSELLKELVVVGYGVQKKESLTGSMEVIKSDDLKTITTPSVENMLNGKLSGVYVASGSGQPGSSGAVVIRGKASINGITAPLWVIDGVIVGNGAGAINPEDIETMTVLKDAASTAIYGSQGANGVILVTTKTAREGQTRVNFSAKAGVSYLNNGNLEMMDGAQLYDYYASFTNADQIAFTRWNEDLRNSNFDWWDVATQTGVTQDYNLSISSGTEKLKSFFSVGIYDEVGAVKGYDYTRYNFRLNTQYTPYKWLTVKPSISGSRRDIFDQQYSTTAMYSMFPWDSPYDENGELVPHRYTGWVNSQQTNYLYDLQWNKSSSTFYEFMGNLDFDVKLADWLTFVSVNNFRWQGYSGSSYTDPRSNAGSGVEGRIYESSSNMVRRYTNQYLAFNKTFNEVHAVDGVLGYEFNDYYYKSISATGTGFIPGFEILDVTALAEDISGGISEWAMQNMFFKGNYAYDNKYLASLSLRRDGASNFGSNVQYGNFWSISAGWNINREEWFKADWVDILKLRAAYGTNGNRPSSLYPQYDLYSISTSASYNTESGALISQIGNPDLTWENTKTLGAGLDVTLFNNRLKATFDVYSKQTEDILFQVPISGIVGITSLWKNVGEMSNKGVELTLGGDIISNKDLLWSIDFNIGHNQNQITSLYGDTEQIIASDGLGIAGSADKLLKPGISSDSFYLREWAGVNPETGAPQWYKTDSDGNRVLTENYNEADRIVTDASTPLFFGGFSTAFTYKNFDLNAFFNYSYGGKIFNYSRLEYDSDGTYTDRNQMVLQDDWSRWEKPGDIATHPAPSYNNTSQANKASTRQLEDGSFLKLKTLSVGYNIALKKYNINNVRVYVSGENLFTITKYSGVDPEIPASGSNVMSSTGPGIYPSVRKFIFGVNVSF